MDREKVIKGLECCANSCGNGCPYADIDDDCQGMLCMDTLALLKEQEAVKPKTTITYNGFHYDYCGNCGRLLPVAQDFEKANYCPSCGRMVDWDA